MESSRREPETAVANRECQKQENWSVESESKKPTDNKLEISEIVTKSTTMPSKAIATEAEIARAAERLGLGRYLSSPGHHRAATGHVHQSLPHGRSHVVSVEIKSSRSRQITPGASKSKPL
jgi:hypothetical protein